ncbi:unnamed protein product [Leptidea sinapis]|uniref:Pacifastin domain-containing protein n=1 Tax=Leptidea sinapis TaxID=189913 RepID=A0A5E4Q1W4_9NEOP|nr:unnamed protein product [Leptidea sinapis]
MPTDTIQDIDVGMEGHGVWRSKPTACTPGVNYRRGSTLCVCDEDGNWPNPMCRDLFRVLHSVELTGQKRVSDNHTCTPTKLYLVGCNVCFCPSTGYLNQNLCTTRNCSSNDPVLTPSDLRNVDDQKESLTVYATCNPERTYHYEKMDCNCLRHNRLACRSYDRSDNGHTMAVDEELDENTCLNRNKMEIFQVGCNYCVCISGDKVMCSTLNCLPDNEVDLSGIPENIQRQLVAPPIDISECVPGTIFKMDCNECQCYNNGLDKMFNCSINPCTNDLKERLHKNCVAHNYYESKCMSCYCYENNGVKSQICSVKSKCDTNDTITRSTVESLRGYCEPLHKYKKDCNECKCLADGETLLCTLKKCAKQKALAVQLVPYRQQVAETCPKGYSYKVDCNICVCLANGNAICTTTDCSRYRH